MQTGQSPLDAFSTHCKTNILVLKEAKLSIIFNLALVMYLKSKFDKNELKIRNYVKKNKLCSVQKYSRVLFHNFGNKGITS